VEELSYSPARYPPSDDRSSLTELQWIQFQLDNSASAEEVLASDTLVRIDGFLFGLHYMVADPSGSVAVIEFLERVFSRLEALLGPDEIPAAEVIADLARYPATAVCAPGHTDPLNPAPPPPTSG
jgi:hypothetical protein